MNKGLIYILTGDGKGKTTAAFGLALRASGYNLRTLVVQFVKSKKWQSGEVIAVNKYLPLVDVYTTGVGFVGIIDDQKPRSLHKKRADEALILVKKKVRQGKYDILILDEINIAIDLDLIKLTDIVDFLKNKPPKLHVVLTGRKAPKKLIDVADVISEIKNLKHPFDKGKLAQKGIDF